jgi:hypothetical protein
MQAGNPFDKATCTNESSVPPTTPSSTETIGVGQVDLEISNLIKSYVDDSPCTKPLVPNCFVTGLFPWISRLLLLLEKLPRIADDISEVFCHISDLYLTTAFRICSGNARNERILLGLDSPAPSISPESVAPARSQGASSPMFGFGRRPSSHSKPAASTTSTSSPSTTVLSAFTDAEICSPLPRELDSVESAWEVLIKAQGKLKTIAKLDLVDAWVPDANPAESRNLAELAVQSARVLEQRQSALWGCVFLTLTLQLGLGIAKSKNAVVVPELVRLEEYIDKAVSTIPRMLEIASRFSCIRAIRGRIIVQQVNATCCCLSSCPTFCDDLVLLTILCRYFPFF